MNANQWEQALALISDPAAAQPGPFQASFPEVQEQTNFDAGDPHVIQHLSHLVVGDTVDSSRVDDDSIAANEISFGAFPRPSALPVVLTSRTPSFPTSLAFLLRSH